MRKNFGAKAYTYPQPVFILAAYDKNGKPNAMNAAWGGISEEHELTMCISPEHKTTKDILARKAFTVSMADADHVAACDYVGVVSGNNEPDKFAKAGFHATRSEFVDAPLIDELAVAVECVLKSYERVLNAEGKVDVASARPITFDPFNNTYVVLGETVGKAFHDGLALR